MNQSNSEPTFLINLRLRSAYLKNQRFYRWRTLPLIGRLFPQSIYGNNGLSIFFLILGLMRALFTTLIKPALYLFILYTAACAVSDGGFIADNPVEAGVIDASMVNAPAGLSAAAVFLHMLVCLTFVGGVLNNGFLITSEETGYAVLLLHMDPRKYAVSEMLIKCTEVCSGTLLTFLWMRLIAGVSLINALLFPVVIFEVKLLCAAGELKVNDMYKADPKKRVTAQAWYIFAVFMFGIVTALLSIRFADYIHIRFVLPLGTIPVAALVLIIPTVLAYLYLNSYKDYYTLYKQILSNESGDNVQTAEVTGASEVLSSKALKEDIEKYGIGHTSSNKNGLAYFNEIFVRRHMSLLTKPAMRVSVVALVMGVLACILVCVNQDIARGASNLIRDSIMVFPFLMYFINKGESITRAMFVNCDSSMLHLRFYRQPATVLKLFVMRLKTVILINMIPTAIISLSLACISILSGMTSREAVYAFAAIIFMGIFFSIHYLGMYYLLQPYTIGIDTLSKPYSIVRMVVYLVIYESMNAEVSLSMAAPVIVIFTVIYTAVISVLIWKFAPKTFRLRTGQ